MSKLSDTLLAVKDINLNKSQLESYHQTFCELKGEMKLELATLLKKKAFFLAEHKDLSVAQRKIEWAVTQEGQRELDLKAYLGAVNANLESTKARLFSIY